MAAEGHRGTQRDSAEGRRGTGVLTGRRSKRFSWSVPNPQDRLSLIHFSDKHLLHVVPSGDREGKSVLPSLTLTGKLSIPLCVLESTAILEDLGTSLNRFPLLSGGKQGQEERWQGVLHRTGQQTHSGAVPEVPGVPHCFTGLL